MSRQSPTLSQILYARIRSAARTRSVCRDFARYEARKAEWIASHPEANSHQYEAAMQRIARECGV